MDEMQPIDALIDSETRLAVVETADDERVIERFREWFNRTGMASYQWTARDGLRRIAVEHIPLPQTERPLDVLDHILASQHFGIYVLCDFQAALSDSRVIDKLARIVADPGPTRKLVLLLGATMRLPAALSSRAEHITLN